MTPDAVADDHVFDLCGGNLALDFSNTVSDRPTAPVERLTTYARLLSFAQQTGILSAAAAKRLDARARRNPAEAARVLAEAIELREAIRATFDALHAGNPIPPAAMEVLNDRHARLRLGPDLVWRAAAGDDSLEAPLAPIVRAAFDLLTAEEARERVKECARDTCRWLFFDSSKNRSRRWCDMKQCGNVEKARRFADRHRS